jgi:hypothetical protein
MLVFKTRIIFSMHNSLVDIVYIGRLSGINISKSPSLSTLSDTSILSLYHTTYRGTICQHASL